MSDLKWHREAGGITVAANVYVDDAALEGEGGGDAMAATAKRDKALADKEALGGLDAVVFKKLPIRESLALTPPEPSP